MDDDFDWTDWFQGFDDDLSPKLIQAATAKLERAELELTWVESYVDDPKGKKVHDEATRALEEAVVGATSLFDDANAMIKAMASEISWLQEVAAAYFSERFAVALEPEFRAEVLAWCQDNCDDFAHWHYGDRSIIVLKNDTDRVHFKLRWGDTIRCP